MPRFENRSHSDETGVETESDAATPLQDRGRQAVVTGSDWTTETIVSQLRKGNIDVNPRFQRREVWDISRKSKLIESIILNLPIPQIVLAEKKNDRNRYVVLDGKQRLLAIRQFCADSRREEDTAFNPLFLARLNLLPDLNRESYESLNVNAVHSDIVDAFDNHTIRTVVIRNWPDNDYLQRVFLRLNTGSVQLSPQELRQALITGPFTDFLDDFATRSSALQSAIGISGPDFRMRDNEVLLRYLSFAIRADEYRGNLKRFLDDSATLLNETWHEDQSALTAEAELCEEAIDVTHSVFGQDDSFCTHDGQEFQGRFNRAVFDIMTYYFRNKSLADAAKRNRSKVKKAFIARSRSDNHFQQALTTTTKSLEATAIRFVAWAQELEAATDVRLAIPRSFMTRAE